jgi:hypothetical protein
MGAATEQPVFRGSRFSRDSYFLRESVFQADRFSGETDFKESRFSRGVSFPGVVNFSRGQAKCCLKFSV